MKPLMYGYLRVEDEAEDEEIARIERELSSFADTEGCCYATTFYEYEPGSHRAFDELAEELKRAAARHVVVPSMNHISAHPILQRHMVMRLELDADVQVFELDGP